MRGAVHRPHQRIAIAALLIFAANVHAQGTTETLVAETVLASSHRHFPEILDALAKRRGADGVVLEADGAFDLVFDADGFNRVDGF